MIETRRFYSELRRKRLSDALEHRRVFRPARARERRGCPGIFGGRATSTEAAGIGIDPAQVRRGTPVRGRGRGALPNPARGGTDHGRGRARRDDETAAAVVIVVVVVSGGATARVHPLELLKPPERRPAVGTELSPSGPTASLGTRAGTVPDPLDDPDQDVAIPGTGGILEEGDQTLLGILDVGLVVAADAIAELLVVEAVIAATDAEAAHRGKVFGPGGGGTPSRQGLGRCVGGGVGVGAPVPSSSSLGRKTERQRIEGVPVPQGGGVDDAGESVVELQLILRLGAIFAARGGERRVRMGCVCKAGSDEKHWRNR
jgi:hypothetical protein